MAKQETMSQEEVRQLLGRQREPCAVMSVDRGEIKADYKTLLLSEAFPIKLLNGNNGQTKHWSTANKFRKQYESEILAMGTYRKPFDVRVRIRITRILGKGERMWDEDSIGRGSAKQFIDAMVACGFFHDDGPKWIAGVEYRQSDGSRANGPCIILDVFSA